MTKRCSEKDSRNKVHVLTADIALSTLFANVLLDGRCTQTNYTNTLVRTWM